MIEKQDPAAYNFLNFEITWEKGMADQPHILLLGDSVLMDGIAESLSKRRFHNMTRINSDARDARTFVNCFIPDLVIYELNAINIDPILTIIREQSDTLHLAVDMTSSQVILLDCRRKPTQSMHELCELICNFVSQPDFIEEVQ